MQPLTLSVIAVFSMWGWNAERPGRRYHAERGNDQGEADEVIALAEKSEVPVGKVIPDEDRSHAPRGNAATDAHRHSGV
jgi:hypothetical protein